MSKKIIAGNWKMNPVTLKEAKLTFGGIKKVASGARKASVLICVPSIYLSDLKKANLGGRVELGAQDCHWADQGAQTGGVSAYMIRDLGVKTTIIGHSERRASGDTDEIINKKVHTALTAGLRVVFCLGETERGKNGDYLAILQRQLEIGLANFPAKLADRLIVAYEPVWAIGKNATGVETPDGFLHNKIFIRKVLAGIVGRKKALLVPVLYGGSVNPQNAGEFLNAGQADGLLVGRDSLNPKNFGEIIKIAETAK